MEMKKDTFQASWNLVYGVAKDVRDWLFKKEEYRNDKSDLIGEVNDAIRELETWKEVIKDFKEKSEE